MHQMLIYHWICQHCDWQKPAVDGDKGIPVTLVVIEVLILSVACYALSPSDSYVSHFDCMKCNTHMLL